MAFITGTSGTVTVQAKLTKHGKKKLFESIGGGPVGQFVTKFALGDSDTDYGAVENGSGPIGAGHVPASGDYLVEPRSLLLYKGIFRPGTPIIFHNGEEANNTTDIEMSIGSMEPVSVDFELKTEWPKDYLFNEGYWIAIKNYPNMDEAVFKQIFTWSWVERDKKVRLTFNGCTPDQLQKLINTDYSGESDIRLDITGSQSRMWSGVNIKLTN